MPYRILCFDGGGVRGVYTARLLERLLAHVPALLSAADLLAGTSTGGLMALGLAAGHSPATLVTLYHDHAPRIFDRSWTRDLATLDGLAGAEYDNQHLKHLVDGFFGATRLEQLTKRVLIPSFQLDNQAPHAGQRQWKPKFFHNYPGPDSDGAELVVDVAMRTSAAPIYFPTYQSYIDGGWSRMTRVWRRWPRRLTLTAAASGSKTCTCARSGRGPIRSTFPGTIWTGGWRIGPNPWSA